MMRVVLDTNVLVSAIIFPSSIPAEIFKAATKRRFQFYTSPFILHEFRRLLEEKFGLSPEEADAAAGIVGAIAEVVEPRQTLTVITSKDDDNRILECAVAAQAEFLVTGDKKHIRKLDIYEGIKIVLPAEFYRVLQERKLLP
ncbi:putative toxin-antitoxin system toxin component, PIN family [Thermodesulfitimonas sp.]